MAVIEINKNPSNRELKQFAGIWFPAFFVLVCAIAFRRTHSWPIVASIAAIVAVISIVGFVMPKFMKPIFLGWMYASYPIGFVVSHVILAAIFYLVITPVGLILRMFGHDPMTRNLDRSATTYWNAHDPGVDRARYFRQY